MRIGVCSRERDRGERDEEEERGRGGKRERRRELTADGRSLLLSSISSHSALSLSLPLFLSPFFCSLYRVSYT
jgi:hypothetical protein